MPNLGSLFEAYGETSAPFFKGLADAEQAHQDQSAKNIEQWLQQQKFGQEKKEFDIRSKQLNQEMDLRKQEGDLRRKEFEQHTTQWNTDEQRKARDDIRKQHLREAIQAAIDPKDPEGTRQRIQNIILEHVENPSEAIDANKLTPAQQARIDFSDNAAAYELQAKMYESDPTTAKYAKMYRDAILTKKPETIRAVAEHIQQRVQKDREDAQKATEAKDKRDEQTRHWKEQLDLERQRVQGELSLRKDMLAQSAQKGDLTRMKEMRDGWEKEVQDKRRTMTELLREKAKLAGSGTAPPDVMQEIEGKLIVLQAEVSGLERLVNQANSSMFGSIGKPRNNQPPTPSSPAPQPSGGGNDPLGLR